MVTVGYRGGGNSGGCGVGVAMMFRKLVLQLLTVAVVSAKIGYFWHITDLHWDPNYFSYENNCMKRSVRVPTGKYGEHICDSPWSLITSAAHAMKEKHGDNIEFILWTGDSLTHSTRLSTQQQLAGVQNLTHLLSHVFSSQFVFPVLGHDDPIGNTRASHMYRQLANLWRHWLPTEAIHTFSKGGYYTIEQKLRKLRLIALNTNMYANEDNTDPDPSGQWAWLENVLAKSHRQKETVYLVGHMAPGVDERQGTPPRPTMSQFHNARYLQLVRKYADIITGQFFGHLHSDTFRIVYSDTGRPVSWIFLAPSVTPRRTSSGVNNPGLRLYKFDSDTGQVLDFVQYYLDLSTANQKDSPEWTVEYNLTSYYGLRHVTPLELHELAETFIIPDGLPLFLRYYHANSVRSYYGHSSSGAVVGNGNAHYCAITRLQYDEYHNCLATAASPLAASAATPLHASLLITVLLSFTVAVTVISDCTPSLLR